MIVATSSQMKEIDRMTIEDYHIPGILLMEHAAIKVMEALECFDKHLTVCVVCGIGNNGGDGLAVARLANLKGREVRVVLVGNPTYQTEDAKTMFRAVRSLDIPVVPVILQSDLEILKDMDPCIVIDALFGIGCTRPLVGYHRETVQWMNESHLGLISIDMPSGIHSDTGQTMGVAVEADITVTFTLPKLGTIMGPGRQAAGDLRVVDIGIPETVLSQFRYNYELVDHDVLSFVPKRSVDGHKMTFGRLLIVAGSETMSGAGILASRAAYRTGAGLVDIVTHANGMTAIQQAVPEAIIHSYANDEEGHLQLEWMKKHLGDFSGILIGPGISKSSLADEMLKTLLAHSLCPIVIDADGLNLLPSHLELLDRYAYPIVLTPHIGEMSRLVGHSTNDILSAPFEYSDAYCQAHGVIMVLKSDRTIIADGSGNFCINVLGNSGMATAGSGDVLAGIILALIGQDLDAYLAAVLGVGLHSLAGDFAADELGEHSLMASDIIEALQQFLKVHDKTSNTFEAYGEKS